MILQTVNWSISEAEYYQRVNRCGMNHFMRKFLSDKSVFVIRHRSLSARMRLQAHQQDILQKCGSNRCPPDYHLQRIPLVSYFEQPLRA